MSAAGGTEKPTVRYFVSYARKDSRLAGQLLAEIRREFANSVEFRFEEWRDTKDLRATEHFHPEISTGIDTCHFGLQLVTLDFLTRPYIRQYETPRFESGSVWPTAPDQRLGIPIALTDLDHSIHDLGGFATQTPFRFQQFGGVGYAFEDCAVGSSRRRRFVRACFIEILETLRKYRPWETPRPASCSAPEGPDEEAKDEEASEDAPAVDDPSPDAAEADPEFRFPLFQPGVVGTLRDIEFFCDAIADFYTEVASDYDCSVTISSRRLRESYSTWMSAWAKADNARPADLKDHFWHAGQIGAALCRHVPINDIWFTRDVTPEEGASEDAATEGQVHFARFGTELCGLLVGFYISLVYELASEKARMSDPKLAKVSEVVGLRALPPHFIRDYPELLKAEGVSALTLRLLYKSLFDTLVWEVRPLDPGRPEPS